MSIILAQYGNYLKLSQISKVFPDDIPLMHVESARKQVQRRLRVCKS